MKKVVLECSNLFKRIGKRNIIKNASFDMREGDIIGFIGPNGAGKTTTIKLILGLQKLTNGKVNINGYDIKRQFEKAIEKVGAIVENPESYTYLTGYKNLRLIANLKKDVNRDRIEEVIELVGLKNRIYDKVSKYSLGMKQRLGIAEAILSKPNVLILDEPTNGLDPEGIKDLREIIKKLAKEENMSILISSHNLSELESFCTRILIIQNGEIIEESNLKEVREDNNYKYIIEVNNIEKAKEYIKNRKYEILSNSNFAIEIKPEEISDFVILLKSHGVNVLEAKKEKMSLEEIFLKKVGGNEIV